jgi:hypothetical protein
MGILYKQRDANYTMLFTIISALHVSGGFSAQSSGANKTVRAALGIFMLSCYLPHQRQIAGKHEHTHGCTYSFISS